MIFVIRTLSNIQETDIKLVRLLKERFPGAKVVCALDCFHSRPSGRYKEITLYGADIFEMTRDWLKSVNLAYLGQKTGWIAGDYAIYAALQYSEWDNAVLVEPDIEFINNSFEDFTRLILENTSDLSAVRLRHAEQWYVWTNHLKIIDSHISSPGMMWFGLLKVSRSLAERCFNYRQQISSHPKVINLESTPNDESIFAGIAFTEGYTTTDWLIEYPELFKYFSTYHKVPAGSFAEELTEPYIVHKAVSDEVYLSHIQEVVDYSVQALPGAHPALIRAAELANSELRHEVIKILAKSTPNIRSEALTKEELDLAFSLIRTSTTPPALYASKIMLSVALHAVFKQPLPYDNIFLLWCAHHLLFGMPEGFNWDRNWIWNKETIVFDFNSRIGFITVDLSSGENNSVNLSIFPRNAKYGQEIKTYMLAHDFSIDFTQESNKIKFNIYLSDDPSSYIEKLKTLILDIKNYLN